MKKLGFTASLWAVLSLMLSSQLSAQQAYFSFGAGYSLPMATQNITHYELYNYTRWEDREEEERVNISFGQGFNLQGSFGYFFNENLGLELEASYLFGNSIKTNFYYLATSTNLQSREVNNELNSQMLRLIPSLVLKTELKSISPRAKFGLVAGMGEINYTVHSHTISEQGKRNHQFDGGISWGFSASIGATYALNSKLEIYADLNVISMSYAPNKAVITEYQVNGVDKLPNLTTEEKEIDFVDENMVDYSLPTFSDQPTRSIKHSLPFSSIGLNIGLIIKI